MTDIYKTIIELAETKLPANKTFKTGSSWKDLYLAGLSKDAIRHLASRLRLREIREIELWAADNPESEETESIDISELHKERDKLLTEVDEFGVISNALPGVDNRDWTLFGHMLISFAYDMHPYLQGQPGVAKTATVKALAEAIGAEYIHFGPTAAPDSAAIPALTDDRKRIRYVLEQKLEGPHRKVIMFDELCRMESDMQSMAMSLLNSKPTLAGKRIYNVIGLVATGNRGEQDGVGHIDPALATRFGNINVDVSAYSVPSWKFYLASQFKDVDLNDVFKFWDNQADDVRRQLSPRKMRKIIWNLVNEGTPNLALALRASVPETFVDATGKDITSKLLKGITSAMGPGRSSAKPRPPIEAAINACISGETTYVEGPPGIGKTDYVEAALQERCPSASLWSLSMANARPEDWSLVMITKEGRLRRTLHEFLEDKSGNDKYVILDEIWRAPNDVRDQVLELCQERTIAGIPTGITGIIALNNPRVVNEVTLNVGTADSAQADRFTVNVSVGPHNIPWRTYLSDKYSSKVKVEHFFDFYDELRPDTAVWFGPRCLEHAIKAHMSGLPLENCLPLIGGEQLELNFAALKAALADNPFTNLEMVRRSLDEYTRVLSLPPEKAAETDAALRSKYLREMEDAHEYHEYQNKLFTAIIRTHVGKLEENRELMRQLWPLLSLQNRNVLVGLNKNTAASVEEERAQKFWESLIAETSISSADLAARSGRAKARNKAK